MTRADKAYYKYRAKTIFWSAFCLIIIAWVGTNLVLCALTTNVESNFDMIYEAAEPTVLPIGREVNNAIRNKTSFSLEDMWDVTVSSVTFDKYNDDGRYMVDGVDVVATCNTDSTRTSLNDDITLYRMNGNKDVYILSNKQIQANPDSSFMFYMLSRCGTFTFNNFNTSLVKNMIGMFAGNSVVRSHFGSKVKTIDTPIKTQILSNKNVHGLAISMPANCFDMSVQKLDLSNWDTSNVTNMYGMFLYCGSLTELNLAGWNTSNVTDMGEMFYLLSDYDATALTTLNLSSFDTCAVDNFDYIFPTSG